MTAETTALIASDRFGVREVQFTLLDGLAIFEGDILLGTRDEVEQQTALLMAESAALPGTYLAPPRAQVRWPGFVVPYAIDPALPDPQRVTGAIGHWEHSTPFRFVQRTAANADAYPDWVHVRPGGHCLAHVGRRGGKQLVILPPDGTLGNTIHEIGHTIGFWHEPSHSDRNTFVTTHWATIRAGTALFPDDARVDGTGLVPDDVAAIMHVPPHPVGRRPELVAP